MNAPAKPLDEDELAELAEFLASDRVSETTMDVAMLDGFLTAIVSGPRPIPAERWLPWVWDFDRGQPDFELPPKQAKRIVGWIRRHMDGIALALEEDPDAFEPLYYERDFDGVVVEVPDEWCMGFVKGIELDPEGWRPLTQAHPELFRALRLHGTEEGWRELDAMEDIAERHEEFLDEIGDAIREIQAHWRGARAAGVGERPEGAAEVSTLAAASASAPPVVQTVQRDLPKVGRNDPCPCGSGRKYKQCHGRTP